MHAIRQHNAHINEYGMHVQMFNYQNFDFLSLFFFRERNDIISSSHNAHENTTNTSALTRTQHQRIPNPFCSPNTIFIQMNFRHECVWPMSREPFLRSGGGSVEKMLGKSMRIEWEWTRGMYIAADVNSTIAAHRYHSTRARAAIRYD